MSSPAVVSRAGRAMTRSASPPTGFWRMESWVARGLVVGFVLLNLGFLALKGVQFGGDTSRYIYGAHALLDGRSLGGYTWAYWGYMAVVAFWQAIGAGLLGVVGFQIGVAAVAGAAVASLGATLGGPLAGLVGAAFLLVNPDVARWHSYILTDSLYISAVVIVAFLVWRAAERGGWWYGLALLALLPAATLRPTALVLLPVAAAFWGMRGIVTRDRLGVALGVIGVVGAMLLVFSPRVQDTAGALPGATLRSGRVIYQHPAFRMEMPQDETPRGAGWRSDLRYIQRHLGPALALGARRVAVELAHVRPYYRPRHNVLIVAMLLPFYSLALIGIAATWRHPLTHLLVALVVAHLLFVAVTLADYDGRFLLYAFGPLAALAAAGVGWLINGARPGSMAAAAPPGARPS
jgi:hypothetical protein